MLSFEDSYTLWSHLPFPRTSKNGDLILAHSDLAVYDEYAVVVTRFVEEGIFKPAPVDLLAELEELMERIDRISGGVVGKDLVAARFQHAYAALLHLVYGQFLEAGRSQES